MSRLTSNAPFNKPSAFDLPPPRPAPLSPPETEMETMLVLPQESRQEEINPVPSEAAAQQTTESPYTHFRRISNLAYNVSAASRREPRPIQRQSRWLVMVMPPASLTREPPTLGHTLSSAPAGRFAKGILIPLFPTLYAQLTAIAREFNMPSTTGLCVYLQLSEPGAPMLTPRISDESWQLLWGHFFTGDDRAAQLPPHGLPISGRIEFDIDLARAKWFDAWMGHTRREWQGSEIFRDPFTHWRGDSRTSEPAVDESPSPPEANPPVTSFTSRTVIQRQVPRPLLLERRDVSSLRSFSRHTSRAPSISHEPVEPEVPAQATAASTELTLAAKTLSPVAQEQDEPQTARNVNLQAKVHQWRQGSSLTGVAINALTAAGQPSLDPVNMPSGTDIKLDMDDFSWSISSAGPASQSPASIKQCEPPPSVHLVGRLQGSVVVTPSVATSFGPIDYELPDSPVSCVSRRPSPDLGLRTLDYVPLTPTTATTWGPDDSTSLTCSEFEPEFRTPSIDIAVRGGMWSRPVTPSTATSWGPPDSPLLPPPAPQYAYTPDISERTLPDFRSWGHEVNVTAHRGDISQETLPRGHVWPYQAHRNGGSVSDAFSAGDLSAQNRTLLPEWPDFASLYPSDPVAERAAVNKTQPVALRESVGYPFLEIYPAAYPYNLDRIYPVDLLGTKGSIHEEQFFETTDNVNGKKLSGSEWPDFTSLYPREPEVERAASNKSLPVTLQRARGYPNIVLYEAVYPHHLDEIYPPIQPAKSVEGIHHLSSFQVSEESAPSKSLPEFPDFTGLYPSDPTAERVAVNKSQPVYLSAPGYPCLTVYPSVYPWNLAEIYGPMASIDIPNEVVGASSGISVRLPVYSGYPAFNLYPASNEYPTFDIYPTVLLGSRDTTISSSNPDANHPSVETHESLYPHLVIYPETQPHSTGDVTHKPMGPRKRPPTPGPGRRRSHGIRPTLPSGDEATQPRRLSRSPIQKDLSVPPLPTVTNDVPPPRRPRLTHLELHCRVFGAGGNAESSEDKQVSRAPRRRKTHEELHRIVFSDLSPEHSQGMDDFTPEIPRRTNAQSPVPKRSGVDRVSSRATTGGFHLDSQQPITFFTEMPRSSSPECIRQRSRSGTVSTRMSTESPHTNLQDWSDTATELPYLVSSPASLGQPSRSDTMDSDASHPPTPSPVVLPSPPLNRTRRPPALTAVNTPSPKTLLRSSSPRPSSLHSSSLRSSALRSNSLQSFPKGV